MSNESKAILKTFVILILGSLLTAVGVQYFLVPYEIFPIGVMGVSTEITYFLDKIIGFGNTETVKGIMYLFLNIPLIMLAYNKIGKKFTIKTLFSIVLISFFTMLIGSPSEAPIDDRAMSVLASALIAGTGLGILLNYGTSTGGSDIIALYFSLKKNKQFGTFNVIFNAVVIVIAVLMSRDLTMAIYMLVLVYVTSYVVDKVHNISQKYTMFIVTNKPDEIKKSLYSSDIIRGITVIDSTGGFTGVTNKTLMVTCEKGEVFPIHKMVNNIDEKAFINVFEASHVFGTFEKTYNKLIK